MLFLVGLDNEFSLYVAAAGTSHKLAEQLQSLFICPEILDSQNGFCLNHCHQFEFFKIKPFAYHLGSYENIGFSFRKILYGLFFHLFALCNVCVIAGNGGIGKKSCKLLLQLFCAGSLVFEGCGSAVLAHSGKVGNIVAVVATEGVVVFVVAQMNIAVGAFWNCSALLTLHNRGVGAAVAENEYLIPLLYGAADFVYEFLRKTAHHLAGFVCLYGIYNLHLRSDCSVVFFCELHQREFL